MQFDAVNFFPVHIGAIAAVQVFDKTARWFCFDSKMVTRNHWIAGNTTLATLTPTDHKTGVFIKYEARACFGTVDDFQFYVDCIQ